MISFGMRNVFNLMGFEIFLINMSKMIIEIGDFFSQKRFNLQAN